MSFILTIIMCTVIDGKTRCVPPYTHGVNYIDSYECLLDGYNTSYNKIVELGREDVNKYNIYIKFECLPQEIVVPKKKPVIEELT